MIQPDDPEPCKLRNAGGSERGTCKCQRPTDCPNPPKFTAMGMVMAGAIDQFLTRVEEMKR